MNIHGKHLKIDGTENKIKYSLRKGCSFHFSIICQFSEMCIRPLPLFQLHVLIAGGVQLGLLFFSMILIVGIARKLTCLIIPWLVVYGLTQVAILASVILCVIYLPGYFKVSYVATEALVK